MSIFPAPAIAAFTPLFLHFRENNSPLLEFMAFTIPIFCLALQVTLLNIFCESEAWFTAFSDILPTCSGSPLCYWHLFQHNLLVTFFLLTPWYILSSLHPPNFAITGLKVLQLTLKSETLLSITYNLSSSSTSYLYSYFTFKVTCSLHPCYPFFWTSLPLWVHLPPCFSGYHSQWFQQYIYDYSRCLALLTVGHMCLVNSPTSIFLHLLSLFLFLGS